MARQALSHHPQVLIKNLLSLVCAALQTVAQLPENNVTSGVADALGQAASESGIKDAVVLMVVQPGETNAYDQQWLQLALWERHKVLPV